MEQVRREVAANKEAEAEKQYEELIRQIRDSCPGKVEKHIQDENKLHLETLKKIKEGQQTFMNTVDEMKAAEALEHEKRKAEILEKMKVKLAGVSKKCDYVTQAALDNLEGATEKLGKETRQLELENSNSNEKRVEFEVQLDQRNYAEVSQQKDKDEAKVQEFTEKIAELTAEQLKEEQQMMRDERAEKKQNAAALIAEVRNDLEEQQKIGNFNLAIQQTAEEAKNRSLINTKITEVKGFVQDLEEFYERVTGVLDATTEIYAKLTPQVKKAARNHLTQFSEILSNTNRKLSEIEQNLATLELKGVDMGTVTRAIKTQISSFSKIISALKTILSLDVPMDETKAKDFTTAKEELFKQINDVQLIPERREELKQCIGKLHDNTTPARAIEN
uniref:MICOS complex subunit MIC60 n=1 Tax=Caenorhabditis tropicalis TaxID=1561998 RepID=A0A1I7SZ09_9PELO